MRYFNDNKILFKKYSLIILFNIIIYILSNFYFKSSDNGFIIMLLLVFITDLFIYNYKEKVNFKFYLDILVSIIIGLILLIFIKDSYIYSIVVISLNLSNNLVFTRSRINEKFIIRTLEYILSFVCILVCTVISIMLFNLIY